jgi:signal transduction histidine kinase
MTATFPGSPALWAESFTCFGMEGMENGVRKILIVDDNPEFARMAGRFLEHQGFRIAIADSGYKAVEKIQSEPQDLVLLDLKLPDVMGMEVLKRIKEINDDIAFIVITGYGGEQVAVDFMKAGALDFLSKPIDNDILLKTIKNALKIRDAQVEDKQLKGYSTLEKFFPFLAHEIRNPLHAIGGALAIIQRRTDLRDELLAQSMKIIQEEIQHLNEFVQECLDFVRPPVRSHYVEVDINELVSIVISITSHMFQESSQKVKVTTHLAPKLPKVQANYEEVKQALLNIVKNGFEAMEEGGEFTVTTTFKPDPKPGWVEITFSDSGTGIREENKKYLFSPFFTTKLRGTGLGLPICHRIIVERHKGRMHFESEETKGTTMKVELPIGHPMEMP